MRSPAYIVLIFFAMLISGAYGALHDQISFTVSPGYFTKFKYYQFRFVDLALPNRAKAALIGFLASWWMGVPIGVLVGALGYLHSPARVMFARTLRAFAVVALTALAVGVSGLVYGWFFASHNLADYSGWFIPRGLAAPRNYLAVGYMHHFSYLGGLIGLLAGIIFQFIQRGPSREK